MASTKFESTDALTRQAWNAELVRELREDLYFDRFMGEGSMNIIQVFRELMRNKGDKITYGLVRKLTGPGVRGDSTLKGNEESVTYQDDSVTLDQLRNAALTDGRLTEQRVNFNIRADIRRNLANWLGEEIDQDIFTAFEASPTKTFFGGDATSTATIGSDDKIDPELISKVKAFAKSTASPHVPPVRIGGVDYFVLVMHPHVAFDMKRDTEFRQTLRESMPRSADHPIFTGALGIWDGVVLHEHPKVGIATNFGAAADQPGATNSFLGRQAGVFAWGREPELVETDDDYGNKYLAASGAIFGFNKSTFASNDYAYISVTTFRTDIS